MNINGITLLSPWEYTHYKKAIPVIDTIWWLQAECDDGRTAPFVRRESRGTGMRAGYLQAPRESLGVRPALQISDIRLSGLRIGDQFVFGKHSFTIIYYTLALCDDTIGSCVYRKDWMVEDPVNANFETTDVKAYIDAWYEKVCQAQSVQSIRWRSMTMRSFLTRY